MKLQCDEMLERLKTTNGHAIWNVLNRWQIFIDYTHVSLTPFPKPSLTLYDSNAPTIGMACLDLIHMIIFVEKLAPIMKLTKGEISVVNSKNMTSTLTMASVTS